MKTSNEINELAAALSKAQAQFTPVLKKAKGVHNSSYAEFIEFIEMAKPHLGEHGLSIVQFPFNENGHVGIINRLMHSSGQWMEHDFGVPPSKKPLRTISGAQLNTLVTLLDNDLDLERRIIEATGVSDLSRLPESQYSAILARLKSLKA